MSRLTDHIQIKLTRNRYPRQESTRSIKLTDVNEHVEQISPVLIGHRIEVTIGAEVRIGQGEASGRHLQHMTRLIEQEVYGEFRVMLYELDQLLFNCDIDGAMRLTEEIRKQMFTA